MSDLETCSHCGEEVLDITLREQADGARICRECRNEEPSHGYWEAGDY